MDRKEAALSLAPDLPMTPDPRGTRFGGLEGPLRGLAIVEAELDPGALRLGLATEPDAEPAAELLVGALEEEAKRANLVLRSRGKGAEAAEDTVLFALHRGERGEAEGAGATDAAGPAPSGFQPPRVRVAGETAEREALRERIARDFREDFTREATKSLDRAEHSLARRVEAL
ncbi:MAG TPA: hypothetical protein VFT93_02840, partial [Candidatus Eisenbacteria bacterium]|nr:hypothetical protein [Candidatus Eisenbacteria bacterium]